MTSLTLCAIVFGIFMTLNFVATTVNAEINGFNGIFECFYEKNSLACAKTRVDDQLDKIEVDVTGRKSTVTFSKVIEEAGALVVDGTRSLFGQNETNDDNEDNDGQKDQGRDIGQARKKFGKKKKRLVQKFLAFAMLIKSKISLILQLISTHFQLKFFVIAVLSLLINATRFWLDLKKSHAPAKVIYYEHAQHQHHYDHDDDHGGYWGRSDDSPAQELAYSGHDSYRR